MQPEGFHLHKFVSINRRVLDSIEEHERSREFGCIDLDKDTLPTERALGMLWSVEADAFKYTIQMKNRPLARRGILSTVSGIYDLLWIGGTSNTSRHVGVPKSVQIKIRMGSGNTA